MEKLQKTLKKKHDFSDISGDAWKIYEEREHLKVPDNFSLFLFKKIKNRNPLSLCRFKHTFPAFFTANCVVISAKSCFRFFCIFVLRRRSAYFSNFFLKKSVFWIFCNFFVSVLRLAGDSSVLKSSKRLVLGHFETRLRRF